ncbi:MAG: hypothetical protein LUM44_22850 [Pyrinomonadaceae bacterium]|nr:hypothetical protein [Pyrinomonadaceae bacterium]
MYTTLYVLIKKQGWGHAFVAFGNSNPSIVFNQSGADGSNSSSGDGARFSRVSWDNAKNYFIVGKDKYFGFKIENGGVMDAFHYANNLFENAPPYPKADKNNHRNRSYNALTQNCATLTAEIVRAAGVWEMNNVVAPIDVWWIMGQLDITWGNISQWGVLERKNGKLTFRGPWGSVFGE